MDVPKKKRVPRGAASLNNNYDKIREKQIEKGRKIQNTFESKWNSEPSWQLKEDWENIY